MVMRPIDFLERIVQNIMCVDLPLHGQLFCPQRVAVCCVSWVRGVGVVICTEMAMATPSGIDH